MNFWALIVSLYSVGRPAAIVGLISAIIVFAIYSQIITISVGDRPIAKWLEVLPLRANANAARTVIRPRDGLRIRASGLHASPDAIETWRRFAESGQAMRRSLAAKLFEFQASARFRNAFSQSHSGGSAGISAVALAVPENSATAILAQGSAYHSKPAETLSGGINQVVFSDRSDRPTGASARSRSKLCAQSVSAGDLLIAAVANTQPSRLRTFADRPSMPCDDAQITEATSDKIVSSRLVASSYRHAENVSDGMFIVQWRA
jgi:hypothetical protein